MLSWCSETVSVLSQTVVIVSWLSPWLDGTTRLLPSASPAPSPWTDRPCGICSVQFSHSLVSDSSRPHESQHTRPPCPSQTPRVSSNSCLSSHDAIQPSHPLSSPSPPAPNPSTHQGLFQWVNSSHEVAKVLEFQLQHQSFQWTPRADLLYDGLVGSHCSPRDSQESSPTLQFKSINFSVLSFPHSPTLTSIHDHWKNQSLDQMDLCWQSNVSAF